MYLTKRDKTGVRFLSQFKGQEDIPVVRVKDLNVLNLPDTYTQKLSEIIYDSRMQWEPWIESAESFDEVKKKIKKRGYTNIPISFSPEFGGSNIALVPEVYTANLEKSKTMLRRRG